jgi:hypothetical protein
MSLLTDEATRRVTAADPQPDENGGCAQCGGPRPAPSKSKHQGAHPLQRTAAEAKRNAIRHQIIEAAKDDPFCSAPCCRAWYGVEYSTYMPHGTPGVNRVHRKVPANRP